MWPSSSYPFCAFSQNITKYERASRVKALYILNIAYFPKSRKNETGFIEYVCNRFGKAETPILFSPPSLSYYRAIWELASGLTPSETEERDYELSYEELSDGELDELQREAREVMGEEMNASNIELEKEKQKRVDDDNENDDDDDDEDDPPYTFLDKRHCYDWTRSFSASSKTPFQSS
ncbi:hypothetical protein AJ80_01058 [Polytolypa hystricis UAMH7299]|uniref:Uncharacterized protein n=1 Tax=Polytolypa hystricis (strain UAMH7299) TaxID=1447883 RepID=A0A2B7Z087_POLH7|nr:hypothetical protein AJ80_01058 [Polytolypa hystricis UAMH7299]